MVCLVKAFPDSLDHFFVLFSIFHVEGVPYFQLFDLLILVISLDFLIRVGKLFDDSKKLTLFFSVHIYYSLFGYLSIEHTMSLVLFEKFILL